MSVYYYAKAVDERLDSKKGIASEEGLCWVVIAVWWESRLAGLWLKEAEEMRYHLHMRRGCHEAFDKEEHYTWKDAVGVGTRKEHS